MQESAFAVKHSTLHLICLPTVMSRRQVTDDVAQPTLTAIPDAWQPRGSAPTGDVADEILRAEGPAHRRDSALLNTPNLTKIPGLDLSQHERRIRQAGRIRNHTLEPHSLRCRLQKQRAGNPCGSRRTLPYLLAADFCFRLPTWLFDPRRRGPHAGFLCDDTGR